MKKKTKHPKLSHTVSSRGGIRTEVLDLSIAIYPRSSEHSDNVHSSQIEIQGRLEQ